MLQREQNVVNKAPELWKSSQGNCHLADCENIIFLTLGFWCHPQSLEQDEQQGPMI